MSYWVLTVNGTVVLRKTVSRDTNLEYQTDKNKARITALDKAIQGSINNEDHVMLRGVRASRRIGVNTLSIANLVFRRISSISPPMRRLQRLDITSCQMYMTTPTSS